MLIQPNSKINILKNCPLDTTYDHTIYFASAQAQANYFTSLTKHSLTNYSYQRVNRSRIRVDILADNLYDCNYLMFQNTAYGNKWFYAFINSIEYVNDNCSEIGFEIDVLQTWHFDYTPDACFVEREHAVTDSLFSNLVPENLETGDYVISKTEQSLMGPLAVCALVTQDAEGYRANGRTINNIYCPLTVIAGITTDQTARLNQALGAFREEGMQDFIASMYLYPAWLGDDQTTTPQSRIVNLNPQFNTIDGYTPKNRKLFSAPYNQLIVSNNEGASYEYKWEQFRTPTSPQFGMTGVFISTPCVIAYPVNYRGLLADYESGITLSNFPQIPWVGDTYKAWLAQNKGSIVSGLISTGVSAGLGIASLATGNPVGAVTSAIGVGTSVAGLVGKISDAQAVPPQVHGQVQCDSLTIGSNRCGYTFYHTSIRAEMARIIDDYFSMFGYATKRCKVPNRNSRPHWNYVKTVGCSISGSVPSDDAKKICSIYNNGVTFWKNGAELGNYTLDNSPT